MRAVVATSRLRRDLRRVTKRGYDKQVFADVVNRLRADLPLEARHRPHKLTGDWIGWWECHVEPDWLLIYRINDHDELELARTGTHSDLFR